MTTRSFPPSGSVAETEACFVVRDHDRQALETEGQSVNLSIFAAIHSVKQTQHDF